MRDPVARCVVFAVAEREGRAGLDIDDRAIHPQSDAVTVQAEGQVNTAIHSKSVQITGQIVFTTIGGGFLIPRLEGGHFFLQRMSYLIAGTTAAEEVLMRFPRLRCRVRFRRQRRRLAEPVGQRLQLLRVFQLFPLFFVQCFIIRFAGGLKRLVDRHGILIVHAVQFRRVRQSVDHRLQVGHGHVLLCGRVLLLFFLFRGLALLLRSRRLVFLLRGRRLIFLLRFHRLIFLLRFRRLVFLLRFPVCRVCRFPHGRGRLRRPLRLRRQRRRGKQRQAQGQRHETTQDTLLHRFPPLVFPRPDRVSTDREYPVGRTPYGPGGAPGQLLQAHGSIVPAFPRFVEPSARNVLFLT